MYKASYPLESIKEVFYEFAAANPLVKHCSCSGKKITKPTHKKHPNAFKTKRAEYNINVQPDHVIVGIRNRAETFTCRLDTDEAYIVKEELKKFLEKRG